MTFFYNVQFKKLMKDLKKPYDRMLTIVSGQKWKDIRSTLSPTFSAAKMKQASFVFIFKFVLIGNTRQIIYLFLTSANKN